MPELPDVEAIRQYLVSQGLVGRTIEKVELFWPRAVRLPSEDEFRTDIAGRRIREVRRRAKYLTLLLSGMPRRTLVLHLRMTGSLVVQPLGRERPQYTRNVLVLDRGLELCFVDPRKLGAMWLVPDAQEILAGLGPEPLDPGFTAESLEQRMGQRNVPVKALLCDQNVVAGIGNIYADEVLFLAGVHPLKRGRLLSPPEVTRLYRAIVSRLPEATEQLLPLAYGGVPPTEGEQGRELLLVPRSEEAPCSHCGTAIKRVTVRGRSSYFCPRCPKE